MFRLVRQVIKKRNVSLKILQERKPNTKQVIISISLKYKILPSKHQRKRSTNAIGLLEWVACLIPIPKNHSDTTHLLLNTSETVSCLSIPFMHLAYEKQDRGDWVNSCWKKWVSLFSYNGRIQALPGVWIKMWFVKIHGKNNFHVS